MTKIIIVTCLLILFGCGDDSNPKYDSISATGIMFKNESGIEYDMPAILKKADSDYAEVQKCIGIYGVPPLVTIRYINDRFDGVYTTKGNNIYIDPGRFNVLKHEFIHYLFFNRSGNLDEDHKSNLFTECS